jgi:hypothetical protein
MPVQVAVAMWAAGGLQLAATRTVVLHVQLQHGTT